MDSELRGHRTFAPPNDRGSGDAVTLGLGDEIGPGDTVVGVVALGDGGGAGGGCVDVQAAASTASTAGTRFTSAGVPSGQYVTRTASNATPVPFERASFVPVTTTRTLRAARVVKTPTVVTRLYVFVAA